jgi:hypothetical protein
MTEPGGDDPRRTEGEEPASSLDAALAAFKPRAEDADSSPVSEGGRSGMKWSPVTDAGNGSGTETEPRPRSSFQFDLGSALAKLGSTTGTSPADDAPDAEAPEADAPDGSEPSEASPTEARQSEPPPSTPVVEPLPTRGTAAPADPLPTRGTAPADPLPTRGAAESPTASDASPLVDRLPTRTPRRDQPVPDATPPRPEPAPEQPVARAQPTKSVFDAVNPSPTLPTTAVRSGAPVVPPQAPTAPAIPSGDGSTLPTLPAAAPAAPPPVIAPIESAPSTPQLNALRSAQLRADRNDRRGKLFGRSVLALVLLGLLVAVALFFGRSYLFPTEWDAELTPLVDEIQSARGTEFDDTVPLVERPATEYAPLVTAQVLGADWSTRLPEWRALGLAAADGAVADVQVRIAALYPAFFDPEADTIVASAERSADARQPALRLALEQVFAHQTVDDGTTEPVPLGLTGLQSMDVTARRAHDAAAAGLVTSAPDAVADLAGVPVPIAYQLRAADRLGEALIDGASDVRPGDPLPAAASRLAEETAAVVGGLLQPGDQQVLAPVALGADDWTLIWSARLSPAVVGPMADSLVADSYSVVSRAGVTCFVAVFQTDSEVTASALLANLTTWVGGAAEGTSATVTPLAPDRVQLEGCDPGSTVTITPAPGATDLVISRQLERFNAG